MGSRGQKPSSSIVHKMAFEFKAAGDEATAMQRAQEFGCLPETVLALAVLTDYRLVGKNADSGILHIEEDWPAAWRVQATRCHQALASGCRDDVDLILRIFSEWQAADNPDGWCALWWVNPAMMYQVESDVGAVFGGLAASGPLGMRRPVDPKRAPQVREALTDAFDDAFFVRVGDGRYRPVGEEVPDGPAFVPSSAVLTEPGEQIIALGSDSEDRVLEHVVCVDAVASPPPVDVLAPLRGQWPVGSLVEIETLGSVSSGRMVTDILTLHRGFPYPEGAPPPPLDVPIETPELLAAPTHATAPIDGAARVRARVTGYRTGDAGQAVLIVDPLAPDAPIDPSDHPDLATWDDIEVIVRGVISDHLGPVLELGRIDCYGSFFTSLDVGLSATDGSFGARLTEGARLTARVLPEPPDGDTLTISLLPEAVRHLETLPGIDNAKPVPAKVIHHEGPLGSVTVELAHKDSITGMSHRFDVESGRLMEGFLPAAGTDVDVVLRPDRSMHRRRLAANADLVGFAQKNADTFSIANGWLELSPSPPDIGAVLALLTFDDSREWEREVVWLYEDNLHLEAALIGPAGSDEVAEVAATLPGFLVTHPRRSEAAPQPPVAEAILAGAADAVTDAAAPVEPVVVEEPLGTVHRMVALLPEGGAQRVEGPGGAALDELRAGRDVLAVALVDDILTVIGKSGRAVRLVIAEAQRLILPAKGKLIMPPGGAKRLIGIDGTTLRALQVRTGCEAHDPGEGELWIVEGPSHAAVKEFMRMAAEQVPGVVGRVTDMDDLEIKVEETVEWVEVEAFVAAQHAKVSDAVMAPPITPPPPPVAEPLEPPEDVPASQPDPASRRPAIKPLKRSESAVTIAEPTRAERRAARAEARAAAQAARAERRAQRAEAAEAERAAQEVAAADVKEAASSAKVQPSPEPIKPKKSKHRSMRVSSRGVRIVALVLAVLAIAAAFWYVLNNFGGDDATAAPAAADTVAAVQVPESVVATFAELSDASAVAPNGCWLAVMATWDNLDQATEGVARMREVGLPATAINSDLVPNWASQRTVGVVPVESAPQAAEAVARAGSVGFSGVAVQSSVAGCTGLDIVPRGATLGFVDVPLGDPDQVAIEWMVDTGLAEPCNPPIGDEYCPDATVTQGELARILTAALTTPPAGLDTSGATATVGDLNAALGEAEGEATPLTRRVLAGTLLRSYRTLGG